MNLKSWMFTAAFVAMLFLGLSIRVPKLSERPLHNDEANQSYRFGILLEEGSYVYDADDHHGPTLYYLTLPIAWLTGAQSYSETSVATYRSLSVVFGALLLLGVPMLRRQLGGIAVLVATLLCALSPGMAYFSRFYIQEISLVFFTFMAVVCGWRSYESGSWRWAVGCGVFLGLMFATKETAILAYAAMGAAIFVNMCLARSFQFPYRNGLIAAGAAALVALVLFSSFFTNAAGPIEAITAFKGYFARGAGLETDHVHPWNFYLRMLTYYRYDGGPVWSEGLVFGLGILGAIVVVLRKVPRSFNLVFCRFLLIYTLALTAIYSLISYKTPWCILSFLHGWILLAGVGVAGVIDLFPRKQWLVVCAMIGLLAWPVHKTYVVAKRTVFAYSADYRNPYVYAHTSSDFRNLVKRIKQLVAVSPKGKQLYIQVIAAPEATWPLPFYLRDFPNVGYWTDASAVPSSPSPDLIIATEDFESDENLYLSEYYGLRADTLLSIHIECGLWESFLDTRR